MTNPQANQTVSPVLRVGIPLCAAAALTAVLFPLFSADEMTALALNPAVVAGVSWAAPLWYVARNFTATASYGSLRRQLAGGANLITILRGGLYSVVAGFVVVPASTELVWVPALCYGAGVVLDRVDGAVARTVGEETPLGTRLDMAFDTFGFVVAPLVAVLWGQLPVWYLSLSAARYVFLGGLYWRRRRGRPVYDQPDSNLGKYLAGVQMVFITTALAPVVPTPLVWAVAPFVLAPSLAVFIRDYLVASGRRSTAGKD